MRVGIISDIHANPYGLDAVMKRLSSCEVILCAGDITGYNKNINEVFDILKDNQVKFILGNHDALLLHGNEKITHPIQRSSLDYTMKMISKENLETLKRTPTFYDKQLDGVNIKMFHGSPWEPLQEYIWPDYPFFEKFEEIDADLIILGHTHIPFIRENVMNPGSCGMSRDNDKRASYGIFETYNYELTLGRVKYDMKQEAIS